MFISNFLSQRLQLSCYSFTWVNPASPESSIDITTVLILMLNQSRIHVLLVCQSNPSYIHHTLDRCPGPGVILERPFCHGVQGSSFVESHIFANSQVKYKVWNFFPVTKYFSLSWNTFQVSPSGKVWKCIWIPDEIGGLFWKSNDRKGKEAVLSSNSGFCVAVNI